MPFPQPTKNNTKRNFRINCLSGPCGFSRHDSECRALTTIVLPTYSVCYILGSTTLTKEDSEGEEMQRLLGWVIVLSCSLPAAKSLIVQSPSGAATVIKVEATAFGRHVQLQGSCQIVHGGMSHSEDFSGTTPLSRSFVGSGIVACFVQNQSGRGEQYEVRIISNEQTVAQGETSNPYGAVTVTANIEPAAGDMTQDVYLLYLLIAATCIGVIPASIAKSKGRNFVEWWIYGAALFVVALPHSLLIKTDAEQMEREKLASGKDRKCPFCAEIIKAEAQVCRFCGREVADRGGGADAPRLVGRSRERHSICSACGAEIRNSQGICVYCASRALG